MFARLSRWLDHTAFPRVEDPEAEGHKVAALRIATGLVLVWRGGLMLRDSWYYFDPVPTPFGEWPLQALAAAAQLTLAVALTVGFKPALSALLLLATHPAFSIWTGTYNLGPMLLTPTLGAFAVLETGRLTAVGARRPALSPAHYRAVYAIVFVAYAGWNFQALLYHVGDAYWLQGQTASVLFTSSYLSEFYGAFRAWERSAPDAYAALSIAVIVLQSLFQLGMLPLMATDRGARFVRGWGWIFILGSLADLQLSILPVVEAIMWTLVFVPPHWFTWRARTRPGPSVAPSRGSAIAAGLFCGAYGVLLLAYFGNGVARFALKRELPEWISDSALVHSGLVAPNVFNREDLTMGDRWPVLERADGSEPGPVPFDGPDGERLAYHRSDLLYFANSLPWRRGMIAVTDLASYHRPGGRGYEYARRLATYDFRRHGSTGHGVYRCRLFRNRASQVALGNDPIRYRPELVYEFTLQVGAPPT